MSKALPAVGAYRDTPLGLQRGYEQGFPETTWAGEEKGPICTGNHAIDESSFVDVECTTFARDFKARCRHDFGPSSLLMAYAKS